MGKRKPFRDDTKTKEGEVFRPRPFDFVAPAIYLTAEMALVASSPIEDAARVFLDPNRIEAFDGREVYGEDRWKTVGLVDQHCWWSSIRFAARTTKSPV